MHDPEFAASYLAALGTGGQTGPLDAFEPCTSQLLLMHPWMSSIATHVSRLQTSSQDWS